MKSILPLLFICVLFFSCATDDDTSNMPMIKENEARIDMSQLGSAVFFTTRVDLENIYYEYDGNNVVVEWSFTSDYPSFGGFQVIFGNGEYDAIAGTGHIFHVVTTDENTTSASLNLDDIGSINRVFTIYIFPLTDSLGILDYNLFYENKPVKGDDVNKKIQYDHGVIKVQYDCNKIQDPSFCPCISGVPSWNEVQLYYENSYVEYESMIYKNSIEVSSYFTPPNSSLWENLGPVSEGNFPMLDEDCDDYSQWISGTNYAADGMVTFEKGVYKTRTEIMNSVVLPSDDPNFEFIGSCNCD
ncbi:hypothetical protein [Aureivirga sp. CE67]|uniref:hypothetical protein n=1 Tax=Aureivirga sp. CE67 TaxID=1788983 RepID=UPI0018C900A4|nr:hypothetical protein [Aureivirga sp. CE67]